MLFNDARQAATLSAVVRPKSGQGSRVAKTCCQGRNRQPLLDTDDPGPLPHQVSSATWLTCFELGCDARGVVREWP